jgi:hypothetical protein
LTTGNWTPERSDALRRDYLQYLSDKKTKVGAMAAMAAKVGATQASVEHVLRRRPDWGKSALEQAGTTQEITEAPQAQEQGRVSSILQLPPKTFEVPLSLGVEARMGHNELWVLFGDVQAPFHDRKAVALTEAIIRDVQPQGIANMGDLSDCYIISDYDRDPHRLMNFQGELDTAAPIQYRLHNAAPSARSYLLEGNHEDRLRRAIWRMPEVAKQIATLRKVRAALQWPELLDLDGAGTQWVPASEQPKLDIVPKIVLTHGSRTAVAAGYAARREQSHYGKSGASGHTHRLAVYRHRDLNGIASWAETGCLCLLDGQSYGQHFDWQQGLVVAEWNPDRKLMDMQDVLFRDGRALWRSREFTATEEVAA